MKKALLIVLILLVVSFGSAAIGTTVTSNVTLSGNYNIYTYYLTSSEANDIITAFHVYAPASPSSIIADTAPAGWTFNADADTENGGVDIYWTASSSGLTYGQTLKVSMKAPCAMQKLDNYNVPGYLGNWGYETVTYAGWGAFVMFPSVSVPSGSMPASVPEPGSLIALALGCMGLVFRRR